MSRKHIQAKVSVNEGESFGDEMIERQKLVVCLETPDGEKSIHIWGVEETISILRFFLNGLRENEYQE